MEAVPFAKPLQSAEDDEDEEELFNEV